MLISIIIPCYNSEKFIRTSAGSVLKQDYKNIELILVDDGSTDGTFEAFKEISLSNPGKVKLVSQENKGAPAARNAGLTVSIGAYIQFLDSDDVLLPGKISHQVSLLKSNKFPEWIAASFIGYYENKKIIDVYQGDVWVGLIKGRLGCTCSNLFSKETMEEVGGWNEEQKSSQESELMFRLLKLKSTVFIDNLPLTEVHGGNEGSISTIDPLNGLQRFFQLRLDFFYFLKEQNMLNKDRKSALSLILLGTLRMIYKKDKKSAINLYQNKYRTTFRPVPGPGISKIYAALILTFGFKISERIFSIFRI